MRISTSMIFDSGVSSMNRQSSSLYHLQQQITSGRRILTPADDPIASARALEVTQSQDILTQYATNQDNATSLLSLEEGQLGGLGDLFQRAKELVMSASGSNVTAAKRQTIAVELRGIYDSMMGIANGSDGQGQYMFSGYQGATQPFGGTVEYLNTGNEVIYSGDDGQRMLQVASGRQLGVNDSGADVFMRVHTGNGYFVTDYATANTGAAAIDTGNVTNPAAWNALANQNLSIHFTSATTYDIVDGASNTLVSGGTYQSGQPIAIPGAGATVTIKGTPAAGDNFSLAPSASQSIFKTLARLIGAIETVGPTTADAAKYDNEMSLALTNIGNAGDNALRVRSAVGARLNELESLGTLNENLSVQQAQTLSSLQDLDYAKAISDLTLKQTQLQAAQQAFTKVSQLSLFNYL